MKQFLINLFKIEQYFYISAIGFKGSVMNYHTSVHHNSWLKVYGGINIKKVANDIKDQNRFDALHIVNIISITKKQYNELNNGN